MYMHYVFDNLWKRVKKREQRFEVLREWKVKKRERGAISELLGLVTKVWGTNWDGVAFTLACTIQAFKA